jgi:outer membrane receptor for ferrienterochelin and colicins
VSRLLLICFFISAALLHPEGVRAQQSVYIYSLETGKPLDDALVAYYPLDSRHSLKTDFSDSKGRVLIKDSATVFITISRLGYISLSDTLAASQNKSYYLKTGNLNLKDVVVTGQFEPVAADKSVHRIRIIDRQRIEQQGAVNLRDVLSNELNIRLSQDAVLGTQMSLMGIGGQNVKILIDGVPVIGRMDGNVDISQINLSNIERIEIIEGPMSVIYGTDALGGVINLITKKPTSRQYTIGLNTYYETVGTYNADMNAGLRYKNVQMAVSGGRNFFDGYSEQEDEKVRWQQWKPREQHFGDAQFRYRYRKQSHRFTSQYFTEKITNRNKPTVTPYAVTAFDDYYLTTRFNNSLYSDFNFNNRSVINLINSYSIFQRRKQTWFKNLVSGEENLSPNPGDQDTSRFDLLLSRLTYTTRNGSVFNSQLGYDINYESGTGSKLKNRRQELGDFAFFYIADIQPDRRLTIRQGIRFIYNTRYGAPVIPSINVKYELTDKLSARASYSQGFRAPSLKEMYLLFVDVNHNIQGNDQLKAERSNNYSLSLTYSRKNVKLPSRTELTFFSNEITDLINLAVVDIQSQLYSYVNVGKYQTHGFSLNSSAEYKNLSFAVGYSLTGRYNILSQTSPADRFSYAKEVRASAGYSLKKQGLSLNLFYKYNGSLPGFAIDADGKLQQTSVGAYSIMDASLSKSFHKNRFSFTAGCKNLLDVKAINYNSTASAHSSGAGNMPIAMGRYVFTAIRINIEKY